MFATKKRQLLPDSCNSAATASVSQSKSMEFLRTCLINVDDENIPLLEITREKAMNLMRVLISNKNSIQEEEYKLIKKKLQLVNNNIKAQEQPSTLRPIDVDLMSLPPPPTYISEHYHEIKDLQQTIIEYENAVKKHRDVQLVVEKNLKNKVHPSVVKFVEKCFDEAVDNYNQHIQTLNAQMNQLRGKGKSGRNRSRRNRSRRLSTRKTRRSSRRKTRRRSRR